MYFPTSPGAKLTTSELAHLNKQICSLHTDTTKSRDLAHFQYYTKPNEAELKSEIDVLAGLLNDAFYPISVGASAPVLTLYSKALKLNYRSLRTSLALIKYYLCPTLTKDMESFFIK